MVGLGGGKAAQRCYVDRSAWSLGLHARLVGGDWVWQWTHLRVDFHAHAGRIVVILLTACFQQTESQLHLHTEFLLGPQGVARRVYVVYLLWCEMKHKAVLLKPCVVVRHQTCGSVEFSQNVIERQLLEPHIWMDGIRVCAKTYRRATRTHKWWWRRRNVVKLGRVVPRMQGWWTCPTSHPVVARHQAACPGGCTGRHVGGRTLEATAGRGSAEPWVGCVYCRMRAGARG